MKCTEERFLADVEGHEMEVVHEHDNVYRHVRFQKPDQSAFWFSLITWPGHLCIAGDMGTYVFARLRDMFEFFRTDDYEGRESGLFINPDYWGSKLSSSDYPRGITEFDPAAFRDAVKDDFDTSRETDDRSEKFYRALWSEIDYDILDPVANGECGEEGARSAVEDFNYDGWTFSDDWWERDLTRFRYHFIWCCYAIAWGVEQYDKSRAAAAVSA
ncbi:MAG: hypothetical protein AAF581_11035 [Planctomycetota bacterium]